MKPFASPGFRVWNLPVPAKVLYSSFCILTIFGMVSSALYYGALVGGGLGGVRSYYAGEDAQPEAPELGATRGPALDIPDESRHLVVAVTYRKLLEVTHFHLFTMPVVLLIVGHLFFATGISERAKLAWIITAAAGVALHIATPWLVRYAGTWMAPLHMLSGILMTTSMSVVTGYPVLAMWFRRTDDRPGVARKDGGPA
jgi:hypothetical protein